MRGDEVYEECSPNAITISAPLIASANLYTKLQRLAVPVTIARAIDLTGPFLAVYL